MDQIFCPSCRLQQPVEHRFCVGCGSSLPRELLANRPAKSVRFFAGIKVDDRDPEGGFLRVSCYLKEQIFSMPEGTVRIPGHHVRFSVWVGEEAQSVLSIPESEARELARFITDELERLDDAEAATEGSKPPSP
jgi:hypothetical protein